MSSRKYEFELTDDEFMMFSYVLQVGINRISAEAAEAKDDGDWIRHGMYSDRGKIADKVQKELAKQYKTIKVKA